MATYKLTEDRLDAFLHLFEQGLEDSTIFEEAKKIFPKLKEEGPYPIDERLTEFNMEMYAYCRGLGLTRKESAHASEFSFALVLKVMTGEGVSLNTLKEFVTKEIYTIANHQKKHMTKIEVGEDGATESTTFLKMSLPKRYGAMAITIVEDEDVLAIEDRSINELLEKRGIPIPTISCEDMEE